MSVDMSQFHDVFFEESFEHLRDMEHLLLEISTEEPDNEALNSIFRAAHSIKGGSGIFGFDALTGLTHVMENILDKARNHELQLTGEIVDLLLVTADQLTAILEAYQNEEEIDWARIEQGIKKLEAVNPDMSQQSTTEEEDGFGFFESTQDSNDDDSFGFFDDESSSQSSNDDGFGFFDEPEKAAEEEDDGFGFFEPLPDKKALEEEDGFGFFEPLPDATSEVESAAKNIEEPTTAQKPVAQAKADTKPNELATQTAPTANTDKQKPSKRAAKKPAAGKSTNSESSTIRVDTSKIDHMVNLVGELVITQSILRMASGEAEGKLAERLETAIDELSRNTRDIQESVMSMRMLPVSFVFNRFPRVIRDLSSKLEKKIELVIQGGTTEVDKGMIEKLVDPLTHLVRNSVDHGIESPEKRIAAGKPETGTITLSAEQRGGNVFINIVDDGGGMNREKILEKAVSNGLPVSDDMPDGDVWKLIFEPGFSTAEAVTDVSGRGVGMDVVRRNIESINGTIDIQSKHGFGSTITVRLPLTLAILDGMCVSAGEQTFIIPLTNITESMILSEGQVSTIGNDRLLHVRDHYWPIISLQDEMAIDTSDDQGAEEVVVLIEASQRRFALLVDSLDGQQQVVIKSLEQHYRRVPNVAGATIMGDGSVALILDIESLSTSARSTKDLEVENE